MKTTVHFSRFLAVRLSALLLCLAASAFADDKKALISSVTETASAVTVHGVNFKQKKGQLQVFITGFASPLVISSYADDTIVAFLPAGITPGSYGVSLFKAKDDGGDGDGVDDFFLTLGEQGAKGDTGATGPQGPMGQTGLKGDAGPIGPQGVQGVVGPSGTQGVKGDTGETGSGFQFRGAWSPGTSALVGDVMTFDGSTYIAVNATSTATPPPNSDWAIYVAKGAPGADGAQGIKGDTGAVGAIGPQGPQGTQGLQGTKGDTGAVGAQGAAGTNGSPGAPGPQGATGAQGPQGVAGVVDYAKAIANQTTVQAGASFNVSGSGAVGGNLTLGGAILKNGNPFIHNAGSQNTFIGETAGNFTINGGGNTASGYGALVSNTTGNNNTVSGAHAAENNTIGSFNTASGNSALQSNTYGNGNTASGYGALASNSGGFNIGIGAFAGENLTTGNSNIDIGNYGAPAESRTTRIGDTTQTRTFISGIFGVTAGAGNTLAVVVDSNGQLGTGLAAATGQVTGTQTFSGGFNLPQTEGPLPGTSTLVIPADAGLIVSFTAVASLTNSTQGCFAEYRIVTSWIGSLPERTFVYLPPAGQFGPVPNAASRTHAFETVPPGAQTIQIYAASPCGGVQLGEFSITGAVLKH